KGASILFSARMPLENWGLTLSYTAGPLRRENRNCPIPLYPIVYQKSVCLLLYPVRYLLLTVPPVYINPLVNQCVTCTCSNLVRLPTDARVNPVPSSSPGLPSPA